MFNFFVSLLPYSKPQLLCCYLELPRPLYCNLLTEILFADSWILKGTTVDIEASQESNLGFLNSGQMLLNWSFQVGCPLKLPDRIYLFLMHYKSMQMSWFTLGVSYTEYETRVLKISTVFLALCICPNWLPYYMHASTGQTSLVPNARTFWREWWQISNKWQLSTNAIVRLWIAT